MKAIQVRSPSKYHSRNYLKTIIQNEGRVDRRNGSCAEFCIEESKMLLWDKETRAAMKQWRNFNGN